MFASVTGAAMTTNVDVRETKWRRRSVAKDTPSQGYSRSLGARGRRERLRPIERTRS